jgi:DNA/RNA endonuclease G (NUC1)
MTFPRSPKVKTIPVSRQFISFVIVAVFVLQHLLIISPQSVKANNTLQSIPFTQNWSNIGIVTIDDDWSNVPGIVGYRGDALTSSPGTNPQTIVADGTSTPIDVNANQTNPNTFATGGVSEFHTTDPVVALQGSGTADAPFLLINLNTNGQSNINVAYNLRDIDGSTDNAVQPVALQYRIGNTGNFTNLPDGFVADASTGPSLATLVTPVSVNLPSAANNQSIVQVRIITNDAVGSDEWVGIDNISITGSFISVPTNQAPSINASTNPITTVNQDAAPFTVNLTGSDDNSIYNWSATAGTGIASVNVIAGQGTANATYNVVLQSGFSGTASFTASLSDNFNSPVSRTVNIAVTPSTPNNPPSIGALTNPVTTVNQDAAPFVVNLSGSDDNNVYNWSATPGTGVSAVTVSGGQGTPNLTYSVTLQSGFSGTASFTAKLSDNVNAQVSSNVTIAVTPAPPPPLDHVVISQVYGGGGNSGATYQNDFVELFNPDTVPHELSGWTIQYGSATGSTWQVQPLGGTIAPGEYYLIKLASNGAVGDVVPEANISGTLNLSGTNGKVALVRNGDALEGCVIGDPVVDLVGYGTANCREGATNAPTLSNATAAFRKNSGFADTNVNGSDFVASTPNANRRTTPIVELPPSTLSSDPRNSGFNAPRDASITVTFTEPVDVAEGWFSISCVNTGLHNSATVASGGANAWIIIPNVNFEPGEQCTVTVNKQFVRDSDDDDLAPNTDLLTSNYNATFTVATGAAPSYPLDVHVMFGNPSNATSDINNPNNFLMEKPEYSLSYNRERGTPNWVSWHLADEWIGTLQRFDTFRADPAVPADWYRVTHVDYTSSGFDRGHMVPNADRDPETSTPINQATFLMTNMIPQAPDNNQGPWANMENYLRTLLPDNEIYIVAGGAGTGGTGSNGGVTTTFANGKVTVPAQTWKVALVIPKDSGDDIARVTASARTVAVIMPNVQGIRNNAWTNYLTSVDQVEALTGYDFYENLPDAIENSVEAGIDGNNPPGTANQIVNVAEDNSVSITLNAAGAGILTYEIVSQPTNGLLSGTGANRTYTPNPNFAGTDSFTFRVKQGQQYSNVSTVTINVTEVNDAPVAGNDTVTIAEDSGANAVNVLANDNDIDGDTLTITAKTDGTNGTVAITGGPGLTYTPAANFDGSDSFTYTVSDGRGGTQTATVSVTVSPVNDSPTFLSITPLSQTVDYSDAVQPIAITVEDVDNTGGSLVVTATGLPNGLTLAQTPGKGEWTISGKANVPAATYQVQLKVTDSLEVVTAGPVTITVAKEKTATEYTGDFDLMTAGPAINTATVRLAAKLTQDNDGSAGDITKATATFKISKFNGGTVSYTVSNVPVNANGEALTTFTLPADTYSITVDVDGGNGYWTANPIYPGLLNITVPTDELRSSGGGWVPDATSASGKANFAFSVTSSKNGQPKGNASFSFSAGGFNYLVKGNSWQDGYLQFSAEPGVTPTVFTRSNLKGNCTVQKIDPVSGLVVASFGNYTFEIFTRDGDLLNPRQRDSYSITVRDNSSAVFHQVGSQNSLITLGGGNITNKAK